MKSRFSAFVLLICMLFTPCFGEAASFSSVQEALDSVAPGQAVLDLGETDWTPQQLLSLKEQLPEGVELRYQARFGKESYTQDTTDFTFPAVNRTVTREEVLALIRLMPKLKTMDMSIRRELGSKYAVAVAVWQCFIAWLLAVIVYQVGMLIM